MKKRGAGALRSLVVAALVVGCDDASGGGLPLVDPEVADAGADGGSDAVPCPEPDGGRALLTRRGCPVILEISIR
jgi:hypothetical protein